MINESIKNWQSEKRELGIIRFMETSDLCDRWAHEVQPDFIPVAMFEADLLCLSNKTGELLVFDHEENGRVLCAAASNQEEFLKTVAILEDHFGKCVKDESYWNDEREAFLVAKQCGEIAGGEGYANFYHMLVGA